MKLKSNKGNAFTIAIISLALLTIFVGTTFMQINNQIRSNKNTLDNTSSKYVSEAGIENASLKLINQIESKVNASDNKELSFKGNEKVNDGFAEVKNELIKAYEKLSDLEGKYNIFNDNLNKLQEIILNNYTSVDLIKDDINEIKWDIVQTLAVQENLEIKFNAKTSVYSILNHINQSQVILYSGKIMHTGDDHGALNINTQPVGGGPIWSVQSEVTKDFIDDGSNTYNYRIASIRDHVMQSLKGSIDNLQSSLYQWNTAKSSLNTLQHQIVNTKFGNYIQSIRYDNPNGFNELLYHKGSPELYYSEIEDVKQRICDRLDESLNNYLIKDVENEIYRIYIEEFTISDRSPETFKLLKEVSKQIETTKINLIELKCKLGFIYTDIGGDITPPEVDDESKGKLYIELESFKGMLADGYDYTVEKINKTPLSVTYNANKVSKVDDLELTIISTGDIRGKTIRREATIVFTTKKQGDGFITNYNIKSYTDS